MEDIPQYDIDINFNLNNSEELEEASNKLQDLDTNSQNAGSSTEELGNKTEESSAGIKDLGDSSGSSADEVNILGDAVAGLASLGLAAEFNSTAMAADKYNVSMAALGQVAGNNNISLDNVRGAIDRVTSATSIGGGQARSYFTMLMNLGVTNTNALADSMIALKGQSAITGAGMEQMSSKMTTIVNGTALSARSLTSLGLSMQQLASTNNMSVEEIKSSWATMTADQKLQALNNAMSQNSSLVTTMNQTTGEQLQEVKNSWASLEITVGQSSTGASQFILGLTNGALQGLNSAVQNIPFAATFASGALAVGSLVTGAKPALDTFNSLSTTVKNGADALKGMGSIMSTTKGIINTLRNAESLRAGVVAVLAGAQGAETLEEGANAAAKSAGIGPTLALAIANNTLLLPILLVTAAVVAVIAILWYLYNTNSSVKNTIDNLINSFKTIAGVIGGAVHQAIAKLEIRLNQIRGVISQVANTVKNNLTGAWNTFTSAINKVLGPLQSAWDKLKAITDLGGLGSIFSGVTYAGFDVSNTDGFAGNNLNQVVKSGNAVNSQNLVINNENNFNGIIEESAKEWVVNSMNEVLTRENLRRGV